MLLRKLTAARLLPIAFAWGPFVDVLEDLWHLGEGFTSAYGWVALAFDAVAACARYFLARWAFSRKRGMTWRLSLGVLLLGIALRLPWLLATVPLAPLQDPIFATTTSRWDWMTGNLLFPSLAVAVHASLLVPMIGRRTAAGADGGAIAIAAFWAVFPSVTISLLGWGENDFGVGAFRSSAFDLRLIAGILLPFVVTMTSVQASRGPGGYGTHAATAVVLWASLPIFCLGIFFASAVPVVPVPSPYIVTATRAPDGTVLRITESPDDPYDVFLTTGTGDDALRSRLAYGDPLWGARIDFTAGGTLGTISAYEIPVASVDTKTRVVTKLAPLTGFVPLLGDPIRFPARSEGAMSTCRAGLAANACGVAESEMDGFVDAGPQDASPATLAPLEGIFEALPVAGHPDAWMSLPTGATGPRPVVVMIHGAGDRPDWQCGGWRRATGEFPFIVCPRGEYVPGESTKNDARYTHRGGAALLAYINASLEALRAKYPGYADTANPVLAGFSLGASEVLALAVQDPARFPRLALVEGAVNAWTVGQVDAYVDGGGSRVLYATGQRSNDTAAHATVQRIGQRHLDARAVFAPVGHTFEVPLEDAVHGQLTWLVDGDPRWAGASAAAPVGSER